MAAATTILAVTGLALAISGGIGKISSGAKQVRDAKRAAKKFRRQEIRNAHRDRRISTRGAELQREEMQRGTATTVDALQAGGIRGVVGGVGKVQAANNLSSWQIGAGLDQQQVALEESKARDEAYMRQMQEKRDDAELANIQAQMNAGHQTKASGWGDIAQSTGSAASTSAFDKKAVAPPADLPPQNPFSVSSSNPFEVTNPLFTGDFTQAQSASNVLINPNTGLPYGQ